MTPKISIIIPVYHVKKYITMCLQSVANQTMTEDIECIIVDDCGGDDSIKIAEDFVDNYKGQIDFKIVYRERNGGLSAARNSGIEVAKGEYLYFLDSDDEITPDCMELMYSLIEKYGKVDLVQGAFFEDLEQKNQPSIFTFPEYTEEQKLIKSFLLQYNGDIVGAQSRLIRKDFLFAHNLFFKEGIIHEDNYWTFFLAKQVRSMAYCDNCTYYHRYNPTSITGNVNVQKEAVAYKVIIESFCQNIDSFLSGEQKELILNNLITALDCHYYMTENDRKLLIRTFRKVNTPSQKILLTLFLKCQHRLLKNKFLHLLIRMYKNKSVI